MGATILVIALLRLGDRLGAWQAAGFGLTLIAGVAIVYSFLLMLITTASWVVRVDNILVIFQSMYEAGRWPVSISSPVPRATLTFLVPIALAITIPASSLAGRLDWPVFAGTLALTTAMLAVSRWFWRQGIRHYAGASA